MAFTNQATSRQALSICPADLAPHLTMPPLHCTICLALPTWERITTCCPGSCASKLRASWCRFCRATEPARGGGLGKHKGGTCCPKSNKLPHLGQTPAAIPVKTKLSPCQAAEGHSGSGRTCGHLDCQSSPPSSPHSCR